MSRGDRRLGRWSPQRRACPGIVLLGRTPGDPLLEHLHL